MKITLLAAGSALLGLVATPLVQELAFAPEAGSTLHKTFETTLDLALDDLAVIFNGQEMDPAMMGMDMSEAAVTINTLVEVIDEYGEIVDGKPAKLTRSFETVSMEAEGGGDGQFANNSDSDLEGAVVTFTWDADADAYELSCDDEDLDLDAISHAGEDMDLREVLPKEDVREGASWSISGGSIVSVLWPGLDWDKAQAALQKGTADADIPMDMDELLGGIFGETEITCTYSGEKEANDKTYQVISIEAKIDHEISIGDAILEMMRANMPPEVDLSLDATMEFAAEMSGEVLWDTDSGHFYTCTMNLEFVLLGTFEGEAEMQGTPMAASAEVEASGTMVRTAIAE